MTESDSGQTEGMSEEELRQEELDILEKQLDIRKLKLASARGEATAHNWVALTAPLNAQLAARDVIPPGPTPTAQASRDTAYYDEVRRAVGRGAPGLLFGTSTKSLERSLAKLTAVEQGESESRHESALAESTSRDSSETAQDSSQKGRSWIWTVPALSALLGLSVMAAAVVGLLAAGAVLHNWWYALVVLLPVLFIARSIVGFARVLHFPHHLISRAVLSHYTFNIEISPEPAKPAKQSAKVSEGQKKG
jgi:hypothetical protein